MKKNQEFTILSENAEWMERSGVNKSVIQSKNIRGCVVF